MSRPPAERLAALLRRHGLAVPARLLADAHRPVAPLLGDLGAAAGPLIGLVGGARLGDFLGNERAIDDFIAALDATEDARGRSG